MKVPCSCGGCSKVENWTRPDTPRGVQMVEVPDYHTGPAYCSITCAVLDGAMTLKTSAKQNDIALPFNDANALEGSSS